MDTTLDSKKSLNELHQISACRIYLQVIFISDISTVDGRFLLPTVLESMNNSIPKSRLEWPK